LAGPAEVVREFASFHSASISGAICPSSPLTLSVTNQRRSQTVVNFKIANANDLANGVFANLGGPEVNLFVLRRTPSIPPWPAGSEPGHRTFLGILNILVLRAKHDVSPLHAFHLYHSGLFVGISLRFRAPSCHASD
jgi:hypothetical protein